MQLTKSINYKSALAFNLYIPEAVNSARGTSRCGCSIITAGRNNYILNIQHMREDAEQVDLHVLLRVASEDGDDLNCLWDTE